MAGIRIKTLMYTFYIKWRTVLKINGILLNFPERFSKSLAEIFPNKSRESYRNWSMPPLRHRALKNATEFNLRSTYFRSNNKLV